MNGSENQYAWTVTVGAKGQIVIPKEARAVFDIQPGDTLILMGDRDRGLAIPPKDHFETVFRLVFGGGKT